MQRWILFHKTWFNFPYPPPFFRSSFKQISLIKAFFKAYFYRLKQILKIYVSFREMKSLSRNYIATQKNVPNENKTGKTKKKIVPYPICSAAAEWSVGVEALEGGASAHVIQSLMDDPSIGAVNVCNWGTMESSRNESFYELKIERNTRKKKMKIWKNK